MDNSSSTRSCLSRREDLIFAGPSFILIRMAKTQVGLVRLSHYAPTAVSDALQKCLGLLGGLPALIRPKSTVFVKINHLSPASRPERGIVTHPVFAGEMLKLLKEMGCTVTVGDDIQSHSDDGFAISGYRQTCEAIGIRLVNLKEAGFKKISLTGSRLKTIYVSPLLLDADFIVNLPKLKTHSFTIFTGAVKNMFGAIPHGLRIDCHRRFPRNDQFSEMLVDIYSSIRPHLTIMDGAVAMEGEGPGAGRCRNLGVVAAGRDGVAVDAVTSKIIGFNPLHILTTADADLRGIGQGRLSQIEILGEPVARLEAPDFKHSAIATGLLRRRIPSRLYGAFYNYLALIPEIVPDRCQRCLECVDICPAGAAREREGKVRLDQTLCIHCMCCHEACRFGAIGIRKRLLARLLNRADALRQGLGRRRSGQR